MMLDVFASYNKLLYAIKYTLYKITTLSRINFAKTHFLKIKVFKSTKNLKNFVWEIRTLNYSVENFER